MTEVLGYAPHPETETIEGEESIYDKAMREVGKIICEKCDIDFTDDCDDTGFFEEIGNRIICCECYEKEEKCCEDNLGEGGCEAGCSGGCCISCCGVPEEE